MNPIFHIFFIAGIIFVGIMTYGWFIVESDPQAYGLDIFKSLSESGWPNNQNIRTPTIERVQRVYIYIILNASPGQIVFVHVMFFTFCLVHFEQLRWRGWMVRYQPLSWFPIPWPQWVYRGHRASDFEDEYYRNSSGNIRMLRDLGDTRGRPGNILNDSRKKSEKRSSRIPISSRIHEPRSEISKLQEQAMRARAQRDSRESETSDPQSQDSDDDGSSEHDVIETELSTEN